ncbi:hypothetical protein cypCar_00030394, partial [Cyprinus carpio]
LFSLLHTAGQTETVLYWQQWRECISKNIMGGKLSKRKKGYDVNDPKEKKEESAVAAVEPAEKMAETPVTESEAAPQEAAARKPTYGCNNRRKNQPAAAAPETPVTEKPTAVTEEPAAAPETPVTEEPTAVTEEPAAAPETPVTEKPGSEPPSAAPEEHATAPEAEDSAVALKDPAPVLEEPVLLPKLEALPVEPVTEEAVEKVVEEAANTSELSTKTTDTTEFTPEPETVTDAAAAPEPVAESAPVSEPVSKELIAEVEMAVPSPEEPTPVTEPESETAAPPEVTLTQASPEPSPEEPTQPEPMVEQKSAEESIPAIVILESTSTNELCLEEPASTITDLKLNNGDCESAGSAEQSASAPPEVNGESHEQAPDVAPADLLESPVEACVNGVKDKEPPQELSVCELKKDLSLDADFQGPAPIGDMAEVPQ